jgi:hypothetical protein
MTIFSLAFADRPGGHRADGALSLQRGDDNVALKWAIPMSGLPWRVSTLPKLLERLGIAAALG